jgi:threonine aldolase
MNYLKEADALLATLSREFKILLHEQQDAQASGIIAAALRQAAQAERELLRKYMAHVMDMEGTAYTEFRPPHPSTLPMTTDDLARLEQIEAEIRAA